MNNYKKLIQCFENMEINYNNESDTTQYIICIQNMKQNSIENKCENTSIILPFNLGRSKVPSCTPSKYIAP